MNRETGSEYEVGSWWEVEIEDEVRIEYEYEYEYEYETRRDESARSPSSR